MNLIDRVLEVHREPSGPRPGGQSAYAAVHTLDADAIIAPLAAPPARIAVADLLP